MREFESPSVHHFMKIEIRVVKGVEGCCLIINDYRVAGPKPWGGGKTIYIWVAELKHLRKALGL
jgi:hypothetical protein